MIHTQGVAIIGIGAVGSVLAKALSKLQPPKMLLLDKEDLEPGNLIRHEAMPIQVELSKAKAVAQLIVPLAKDATVHHCKTNVVKNQKSNTLLEEYDVIFDASGNFSVHRWLSENLELADKIIVWCYVKPGPDFGVIVCRRAGSRLTLSAAEDLLRSHVDTETWLRYEGSKEQDEGLVWPEPGCYQPTFQAPYHRLRMMADGFLTTFIAWQEAGTPSDLITLYRQVPLEGGYGLETRIDAQIEYNA